MVCNWKGSLSDVRRRLTDSRRPESYSCAKREFLAECIFWEKAFQICVIATCWSFRKSLSAIQLLTVEMAMSIPSGPRLTFSIFLGSCVFFGLWGCFSTPWTLVVPPWNTAGRHWPEPQGNILRCYDVCHELDFRCPFGVLGPTKSYSQAIIKGNELCRSKIRSLCLTIFVLWRLINQLRSDTRRTLLPLEVHSGSPQVWQSSIVVLWKPRLDEMNLSSEGIYNISILDPEALANQLAFLHWKQGIHRPNRRYFCRHLWLFTFDGPLVTWLLSESTVAWFMLYDWFMNKDFLHVLSFDSFDGLLFDYIAIVQKRFHSQHLCNNSM